MRWPGLPSKWRNIPLAVGGIVALLLLAAYGIVYQAEQGYRAQKVREAHVQADILAASVTAAVDFGDAAAAQEAVNALRLNLQVKAAGVYDADGRLFVGYERTSGILPRRLPSAGVLPSNLIRTEVPVVREGKKVGSVFMASMREPLGRRMMRYVMTFLLAGMAAVVVAVLGIATYMLRKSNRQLEERAGDLARAYESLRIESEERAKAEEQLRQAQKMQALGQLTGGIAHDFNNMLTVIQGSADILQRPNLAEEKRIRFAEAIAQTSSRAAALTGQLLAFARRQPLQPETIDLNRLIEAMSELLDRTLGEIIEVRAELDDRICPIIVDPAQLEAAILNIAVNARDAMTEGGTLTIRTGEAPPLHEGQKAISLSLSDTGSGMDPDTLARVFEPFFTTKPTGKGTGLGLSQVYGFASQSGGEVHVGSEPGKGTTVTLILPCIEGAVTEKAAVQTMLGSRWTGRILLVDDNEGVGTFAEALLEELGHQVVRTTNGADALATARVEQFDAVLTDVVMPGMSGLELAEEIKKLRPAWPIVLTTGYSDQVNMSGSGGLPVLFKPYRLDTLAAVLDEALAGRGGGQTAETQAT